MEGKRRGRGQVQKNLRSNNRRIKNRNDNLTHKFDYNICEQVVGRCKSLSSPNPNETIYKSKNISGEKDFKKGLDSYSHNNNVSTTGLSLLQSYQVDEEIVEEESSRANDIVGIQVVALSDKASVPSQFALMLAKEKEEGELSEEREEIQGEDSNTLKNGNLSSNCNRPERSSSADGGKAKFNRNKKCLSTESQNNCKKQVSLLEMLLAKEIRHERNIILQCIRYIVSECFFEK